MRDATMRLLARAYLDMLPETAFRHHGIGVLQAYIRENVEPEMRIHVWHPDLVRPGIMESGAIHDHRFDLESTIVLGTLSERWFGEVQEDEFRGPWRIWSVENARSAGAAKNFDGKCEAISGRVRLNVANAVYRVGETYTHARGIFHMTIPSELAVTVCVMKRKSGQARLLVPWDKEPVHAFGKPCSPETRKRILNLAREALG